MLLRIFLVSILFLLLSCSSNDESPNENETPIPQKQYLTSLGGNEIDTLVYSDNKLILRKEYVQDFLDYNHHYLYNDKNELITINKIHSTSTLPSIETTYTYYPDGNLKSRHYVGYNSDFTQTYTYHANTIFVNEETPSAIRMNLNAEGHIISADKYNDSENRFINFINLEYDANGNIVKAAERYGEDDPYRTFTYTFDDKINPLFVFDYKMPNGFTILQMEAVYSHPNFGGYSPGDNDDMLVYFNKNNITSITSQNGTGYFNLEYNTKNYPTKIALPYSNNDNYITLKYEL